MTYSEAVRPGTGTEPETVTVRFSGKDLEMIRKYMKALEARSVEGAILHAVKVSLKRVYGLPAYDEYREKDKDEH